MITHVTIENFKSHKRTDLDLGRLTLLVGPNSSGKSSVLDAIESLYRQRDGKRVVAWSDVPRAEVHRRRNSEGAIVISIRSTGIGGAESTYSFSLSFTSDGKIDMIEVDKNFLSGRSALLQLDARKIASPNVSEASPARMQDDGTGVANIIAEWKLADDERLGSVMVALKKVVPTFERVRARSTMLGSAVGYELVFDFKGATGIPAGLVSEGTLVALGILVAVKSCAGSIIVLIDDIERALHPRAQVELVNILKALLEETPDLQIVATTHSPYLLDAVDAKDVWVFALDEEGATACCRLTDHPRAEKALEVLTPGEFYSSEDPKWVTEVRRG